MPHQALQDLQRYTGIQHVHRIGMAERMWRDKRINGSKLMSASLSNEHFWMLIDIPPVYSGKMIQALRAHLVLGKERINICESHNVSLSYCQLS